MRFDALTRAFGSLADRRTTARALVVSAIGVLGLAATHAAEAKKKKKKKKKKPCTSPNTKCGKNGCCKPGQACRNGACEGLCTFTKTATTWTLQRDCVTTSPIDIPDGVTLDGDGHTIVLVGKPISVRYGVGLQGGTATVRNLTLDGSGVTSTCADRGVGILVGDASAVIEDTTITGLAASCGDAIRVIVGNAATRTVTIDTVSIADAQVGINTSAINTLILTVTECDMEAVNFGVQVQYNVEATIDSNEIAANTYGVVIVASAAVNAAPDVTATGNTVTGAQIGMSVALAEAATSTVTPTLDATGNTIIGPGPIAAGGTHGLFFGKQAAGSATTNTISNFFDNRANVGCGIFVAANAGAVTIGTNAFPAPGNEQNVCDFRS
jgi:hypothetical protein